MFNLINYTKTMKTWEIKLTVSVADSWIADGFDMAERLGDLTEQVQSMLPYAYTHEIAVKAKITKAPDAKQIAALQKPKD